MSQSVNNISDSRRELSRLKQELDDTYQRYQSALIGIPINFQGDVHKYMCIRLSGYLERLFLVSITGFLKSHTTNEKASAFALSHFKNAPNMTPANLDKLILRFGSDWKNELDIFLDLSNRKDTLSTLLNVRNMTAHGGSYQGSAPQIGTYKMLVDDLHKWVFRVILN